VSNSASFRSQSSTKTRISTIFSARDVDEIRQFASIRNGKAFMRALVRYFSLETKLLRTEYEHKKLDPLFDGFKRNGKLEQAAKIARLIRDASSERGSDSLDRELAEILKR